MLGPRNKGNLVAHDGYGDLPGQEAVPDSLPHRIDHHVQRQNPRISSTFGEKYVAPRDPDPKHPPVQGVKRPAPGPGPSLTDPVEFRQVSKFDASIIFYLYNVIAT